MECVQSAHADVLVNGSPSGDFKLGRGLRQGDPLSPFLFIIAAEGIGVLLKRAIRCGLYDPIEVGPTKTVVSHLQFADDTVFLGKASLKNALFLKRFLILLEASSGLKINQDKCQVVSIHSEPGIIEDIAGILCSKIVSAPFKYLGVMVGSQHRKVKDWKYVLDKVKNRLSDWSKLKISLGGRITLVKFVLSALPTYVLSVFRAPLSVIKKLISLQQAFLWGGGVSGKKLVWAKWDSLTAPKSFGGLGFKDLVSFNKALIGKWAWRAIGGEDTLWLEIVKGNLGRAGEHGSNADLIQQGQWVRGWWGEVLNCLTDGEGDWFASSLFRKVGSGSNTSFWEDLWVGDVNLRSTFPRLFALSSDKSCTVAEAGEWIDNRWVWGRGWRREMRAWELESLSKLTDLLECRKSVSSAPDLWLWKPEPNNTYRVKSAYNVLLDRKLEVNNDIKKTCNLIWSNCAVPKVQATAWRVIFRRIATKAELRRRGIPFQQTGVGCPLCDGPEETIDHLFVECRCVWTLWSSCLDWIGFQAPLINRLPVNFLHFCSLAQDKRKQTWLAALWCCTVWTTWRKRNAIVFSNGVWNHDKIFGEIKSFMWSWGVGKEGYMKPSMSFNCWSKKPLS